MNIEFIARKTSIINYYIIKRAINRSFINIDFYTHEYYLRILL